MHRRKFFKTSLALGGLGVVGTAAFIESCSKNNTSTTPQGPTVNFTLDLSAQANAALNTSGGSVYSNGVIVANSGNNTFIAVAEACTHAGCNINYNLNQNDFVCPCHGGTYDINGNVTSGPPPAPLKKYTVTKNGYILTISG
jgi:cytochrome b6-f complex iron-sulfur subunit